MENPPKVRIIEISPADYIGQSYMEIQDCPLFRAAKRAGFDVGHVGVDCIVVRGESGRFTKVLKLNQVFHPMHYREVASGKTLFRTVNLEGDINNGDGN